MGVLWCLSPEREQRTTFSKIILLRYVLLLCTTRLTFWGILEEFFRFAFLRKKKMPQMLLCLHHWMCSTKDCNFSIMPNIKNSTFPRLLSICINTNVYFSYCFTASSLESHSFIMCTDISHFRVVFAFFLFLYVYVWGFFNRERPSHLFLVKSVNWVRPLPL